MSIDDLRRQISAIGRQTVTLGLVKASSGNLSARLPGADEILITPSGAALDALDPAELVCLGLDGQIRSGARPPSSELLLHLAMYRRHPAIHAVVHLHPPFATVVGTALGAVRPVTFEGLYYLDEVGIVPPLLPGSEELAQAAAQAADRSRVLVLQHHGSVCLGADLQEALYRSIELEETSRLIVIARSLGAEAYLPTWAIAAMQGRRY
jgi:L-fuculose-phosphate aldolase